jgi:hypothetical protein
MDTMPVAELHTNVDALIGKVITFTDTLTGTVITGKVYEATVSTIDADSPLYVEGLSFVKSVRIDGIGSVELATPFISDYMRGKYSYYLVTSQA